MVAFGFSRCDRDQWVIGPGVFRVATLHFLFDVVIGRTPETGEVLGNLQRPARGGQ